MKRTPSMSDRIDHLLARVPVPQLPEKITVPYGGLIKTGFWMLAFAWFWSAGAHTNVVSVFRGTPDYVQTQQISICRSYRSSSARAECVTRFLVGASNENFYRVALTFLPPLLLVPICGRALRRIGPAVRRRVRIL